MLLRGEAYIFQLDHNGFQHLQVVIIVKGAISSDVDRLAALHSKLVEIHIDEPVVHHHSGASKLREVMDHPPSS